MAGRQNQEIEDFHLGTQAPTGHVGIASFVFAGARTSTFTSVEIKYLAISSGASLLLNQEI